MISTIEKIEFENIEHYKFNNLYYIDSKFYYFCIDDINLKKIKILGGPEHTNNISLSEDTLLPIVKKFNNEGEIKMYVNTLNIKELEEPTLYFSHYYEHNIGHGLYDALYPIYLCYLHFYKNNENDPFNIFLNILTVPNWSMPINYIATREWVLNIFKDFCKGGKFMIKNQTNHNLKFNNLLVGANRAGIASTNKMGIMPGKNIYALEKFRNRFFNIYNIIKSHKNNINILFIDSDRYSEQEKKSLMELVSYYKEKNYNVKYINWKGYSRF